MIRQGSADRQDRDEVARPARLALVGRTVLSGHLGDQGGTWGRRGGKLDPIWVDVEFHGGDGARTDQGVGQVGGDRRHAGRVEQVTGGVLPKCAPRNGRTTAEGGTPRRHVADLRARLPAHDEGRKVLADTGDLVTGSRAVLAPHAHLPRSEERRVGKEGRSRWSPYH